MKFFHTILAVLIIAIAITAYADVEDEPEEIIEDAHESAVVGRKRGNFVPVPMIISNPTMGTGLQAVLMYLHPKSEKDSRSPNATSGLTGMYTNTDSWFIGIFHDDYLADDTYRFAGFLGYGDFNLKYYGIGDSPILGDRPIDYQMTGLIFAPKFQRRIPKTNNWFAGVQYIYFKSDILFKTSGVLPILPDIGEQISTAGLGLVGTYDSRDNNYYPEKGQLFEAKWTNYSESWGGDFSYNKFTTFVNHYQPFKEKTVLALRTRAELSDGDTPFFDLPYLDMRGFARDRYRDQHTLSVHAEARHKFRPRWGAIVFVESGWFGEDFDDLFSNRTIISYGGGIRWQVTKGQKMNLGLDVAFSEDDSAVYIQIGEQF